jgi:hypothetical protein
VEYLCVDVIFEALRRHGKELGIAGRLVHVDPWLKCL